MCSTREAIVCKNCMNTCSGNFCYHCGQRTATGRLTLRQLGLSAFFTLTNVNQGFLYTIQALWRRPGKAVREYAAGRRVNYYPPHKYVLLIGAAATFFAARYQFFSTRYAFMGEQAVTDTLPAGFLAYADTYTTVINVVTIPVFALFSWWLLSKNAWNYAENMVLNSYITAQQLLLFVCMAPLFEIHFFPHQFLLPFYILLTLLYNVWVYVQFFRLSGWKGFALATVVMVAAYGCQFLLNLLFFLLLQHLILLP
jgi:hypothetical protein